MHLLLKELKAECCSPSFSNVVSEDPPSQHAIVEAICAKSSAQKLFFSHHAAQNNIRHA